MSLMIQKLRQSLPIDWTELDWTILVIASPLRVAKTYKRALYRLRPGYRIYFGIQDITIVIFLIAEDKKSQHRDIEKAKKY